MEKNNTATLIGIMGDEAQIRTNSITGKDFAFFSLGTSESYKDKETGEYKYTKTIWHEIKVNNPKLIQEVKNFKKLTRLKIRGTIYYKDIPLETPEGKEIKIPQASIVAKFIEQAALPKKKEEEVSITQEEATELEAEVSDIPL